MRTTKALACVAVMAAGLATSMAQSNVYSLNVVGYYNVTVPSGKYFAVANQLNTTNNTIPFVLPTVVDDTELFKFIGGGYQASTYEDFLGGWDQPTWTLNPGETAMLFNPSSNPSQTFTFVGEVLQGSLTNTLPIGSICFRSSIVPQQGTPADFSLPAENDDQIYVFNNGYASDTYEDFLGGWGDNSGAGPTILVGQGFGYKKASTGTSSSWVRNFTVQ
jgi:hypothetical protein